MDETAVLDKVDVRRESDREVSSRCVQALQWSESLGQAPKSNLRDFAIGSSADR